MPIAVYGAVFAISLLAGPVLAIANAEPIPGEISLVIGPPWRSLEALVTASDGKLIGPGANRYGALAVSDNPDFFDDLKASGAWFVLDGTRMAQLCGVET